MRKTLLLIILISSLSACSDDNDSVDIECCGKDTLVIDTNNLSVNAELLAFNVITPNGDGINDQFIIARLIAYPNNNLKVFFENRLVFESDNYHLNQEFGNDLIDDSFERRIFTYELSVDDGNSFRATGTICAVKSLNQNVESCNAFNLVDPFLNDCIN